MDVVVCSSLMTSRRPWRTPSSPCWKVGIRPLRWRAGHAPLPPAIAGPRCITLGLPSIRETRVRLQRLLSMPPEELACRSRQEFSKLLERFNLRNEDGPRCRLDAQTNDQELRQIRSLLEAGHNELAAP